MSHRRYGNYVDCEPVKCLCEYTNCEHKYDISKRYGSYVYGSGHILSQIVDCLLDYQEDSVRTICEETISLKSIAEATGYKSCKRKMIDKDCVIICGTAYRVWEVSTCTECEDFTFTDDHYLNIIETVEYRNYPNRNNIESITDIFGFGLLYTFDYINITIGNNDPEEFATLLDLIPTPIGEKVRILSNC